MTSYWEAQDRRRHRRRCPSGARRSRSSSAKSRDDDGGGDGGDYRGMTTPVVTTPSVVAVERKWRNCTTYMAVVVADCVREQIGEPTWTRASRKRGDSAAAKTVGEEKR